MTEPCPSGKVKSPRSSHINLETPKQIESRWTPTAYSPTPQKSMMAGNTGTMKHNMRPRIRIVLGRAGSAQGGGEECGASDSAPPSGRNRSEFGVGSSILSIPLCATMCVPNLRVVITIQLRAYPVVVDDNMVLTCSAICEYRMIRTNFTVRYLRRLMKTYHMSVSVQRTKVPRQILEACGAEELHVPKASSSSS